MKENDILQAQAQNLLAQQTGTKEKYDNGLTRALKSCCVIPQRYILGLMGLLAICNAYTMRICLNLAITQMVNKTKTESFHKIDPYACPSESILNPNSTAEVVEKPYAIFEWVEETQGLIFSAFYYGYAITQVPGGYLAEKCGGKWTLGLGLLSTAVFTFLTPFVIRIGGATGLFILRVLQGMGEGPVVPALMNMLARWVPPNERSFQGALVFGGSQIGNVFGSFMSGLLLSGGRDWAYVFYFFGGFSILWFVLWSLFCYSTPNSHPFITEKELSYLKKTVTTAETQNLKDPVPWKAIVRSAPAWALVWAAVGHDWGYYTMVTDLPKYSHDVLKFNIAATGTLTALPYIAMWVSSFIFCFISELGIQKGWHSVKTSRIFYTSIAATGPAICIILASYSGCDRTAAMAYFILSMALMAAFYPGMKSTLAQWREAFWVCFAVLVGTNVIYCIWADEKQQWWDDVRQYGYPDGWKHGSLTRDPNPEKPETIVLPDENVE